MVRWFYKIIITPLQELSENTLHKSSKLQFLNKHPKTYFRPTPTHWNSGVNLVKQLYKALAPLSPKYVNMNSSKTNPEKQNSLPTRTALVVIKEQSCNSRQAGTCPRPNLSPSYLLVVRPSHLFAESVGQSCIFPSSQTPFVVVRFRCLNGLEPSCAGGGLFLPRLGLKQKTLRRHASQKV